MESDQVLGLHRFTSAQAEKRRPLIGVATIVLRNQKILLGKRKGSLGEGQWACPGGHLEFGESVEACARRELKEETGLDAISLRLGPWIENVMEQGQNHYITLFVLVDRFSGEPQLLEPHKCEGWEWFDWEDPPSPLFPTIVSLRDKFPLNDLLDCQF
ncbi:NUDIX hydrolase [Parachlamydia sp. AcF125]|uniref:nucleotide triphosphate diphosphatase NUDT15 n=1 Tax=Parachlamydia sp. AcF125 TaxID=2795736 RepID=UPI001BC9675A|nr:NUDIX hydrolase [Parachlamydia sp. AcF125]MBS4168720.1 RNA pyrophosphohydrolase [Parachlamydia sp. AcF125]